MSNKMNEKWSERKWNEWMTHEVNEDEVTRRKMIEEWSDMNEKLHEWEVKN